MWLWDVSGVCAVSGSGVACVAHTPINCKPFWSWTMKPATHPWECAGIFHCRIGISDCEVSNCPKLGFSRHCLLCYVSWMLVEAVVTRWTSLGGHHEVYTIAHSSKCTYKSICTYYRYSQVWHGYSEYSPLWLAAKRVLLVPPGPYHLQYGAHHCFFVILFYMGTHLAPPSKFCQDLKF